MTMLPLATAFTASTVTEADVKTALTALRAFLYEKLGDNGSVAVQAFASGTKMLFQQTAAPTGWTKDTTHNDKALRVVSGTASSGGTNAFSTVFGKTATDAFTLTTAHVPSHSHTANVFGNAADGSGMGISPSQIFASYFSTTTSSSGSGGSHSHGMDIRVQYVDLIIATKD